MTEYSFVSKTLIDKGWSDDKKYCAVGVDGVKYLLRVSSKDKYDRRKSAVRMMGQVAELGVPVPCPVDFGECDEGVYTLEVFIEGDDAEDVIATLPLCEQYRYGVLAGKYLRLIHSIPAPTENNDGTPREPWDVRFGRKMDRKIKMYAECPLKYEGGESFIEYINANRRLIAGRPQTYQHGDYHIGNMMIESDGKLIIIDFDRDDYGDPWEEFNRIVWCAQKAPPFATGMVDGYFDGEVPEEFWRLLALYISSNALSSLPWAIPFGEGEIETMMKQSEEILKWYDGMNKIVPSWYQPIELK